MERENDGRDKTVVGGGWKMTRDETKKLVYLITKAFPRFTIVEDKEGMDLWHECLSDMEYDDARKCVIESVKSNEFPPTIAEIRKLYDVLIADKRKVQAEINRYYEQARSYYPGSGEYGNGRAEFFGRANTPEQAERLYNAIVRYVNGCTDSVMDFVECVKGVAI